MVLLASLPSAVLGLVAIGIFLNQQGMDGAHVRAILRVIVLALVLVPTVLAGLVSSVGPFRGLRWLFDDRPQVVLDDWGVQLVAGAARQWAIPWGSVERAVGTGFPFRRIDVHARDGRSLRLPSSFTDARIAGTDHRVDLRRLIDAAAARHRPQTRVSQA